MARRQRKRREPRTWTKWRYVHILCKCNGGSGAVVSIGPNALAKYNDAPADERVMKCGECKVSANYEEVERK